MRACIQWLALAPLLVLAGCSTSPLPASDAGVPLSGADAALAEAMAHYSQGLISDNTLGESRSALSHYREAAALDRGNLSLNLKVALDYLARKDYTNAVAVLEQTARFNSRSVEIQLLLGSTYQALGNGSTREAVRAFRRALRLDPERPDAYVRLASLYVIRLEPRKALAVVDEGFAALKDPNPLLDLCAAVGRIYLAGKDTAGAVRMFEKVFTGGAGHEDTCELLGQCYVLLGRNNEALSVFQTLLTRHPGNGRYAQLLGEVYERQEDLPHAMEAYRRSLAGMHPDALVVLRLANLEMMGEPEKGLDTLEQAVTTFPDDLRIHIFLAISYMRLDRAEEAVRQFDWVAGVLNRDATAAKMIQPLFYFWFGQACDRAGRAEEAERYIGQYLALTPQSGEALNYLAYMWAEQGRNLDQALRHVTLALKQEPDNGAYLDTLGWIYFKKGDYAAAINPLARALKREGDSPTILDHLGDAWAAQKDQRKAVSFWRRSLKLDPANKAVREKLVRAGVDPGVLPFLKKTPGQGAAGRFPF